MPQARPLVLIVDDESSVLAFVATVLDRFDFTPLTAGSGGAGVTALRRFRPGELAMVLLDVNMPGMDGPRTLVAMRKVDPHLKCCFMSGGSIQYTPEELHGLGIEGILLKPFKYEALANMLKNAIPALAY